MQWCFRCESHYNDASTVIHFTMMLSRCHVQWCFHSATYNDAFTVLCYHDAFTVSGTMMLSLCLVQWCFHCVTLWWCFHCATWQRCLMVSRFKDAFTVKDALIVKDAFTVLVTQMRSLWHVVNRQLLSYNYIRDIFYYLKVTGSGTYVIRSHFFQWISPSTSSTNHNDAFIKS
jgi:hypothetical protein